MSPPTRDVLVVGPQGREWWHGATCQQGRALAQHTSERPAARGRWLVAGEYRTPLNPCACASRSDRTERCTCWRPVELVCGPVDYPAPDCRLCRGVGWVLCTQCGGTGARPVDGRPDAREA